MDPQFRELIHAYIDDSLSHDEVVKLSAWIQASPENAQDFAREIMLHDRLQCEVKAGVLDETPEADELIRQEELNARESVWQKPKDSGLSSKRTGLLALAVCLMVMVGVVAWQPWKTDLPVAVESLDTPFAEVSQMVNVVWDPSESYQLNQRVGSKRMVFSSGILRLEFDDGVEVTIEGPADYELVAAGQTRLHSGVLSAVVPAGAEGFKVDTPNATVTDLGTAFGIQLDDTGDVKVAVFDGEVDVALHESDQQRLLKEGEAVRVDQGRTIESVDFDTRPFEKIWPVSSGIKGSTGAFRFKPPWPRQLRYTRSNDEIFVLPEGFRATLSKPMNVNISEPGEYRLERDLTPASIEQGTPIRSFLLHYRPEKPGARAGISGSITFDRPVLGLIVLQKELSESKKLLTPRRIEDVKEGRQLELTGTRAGDSVVLSEDRHTVNLKLAVPRRFADLVRVILDDRPTSRPVNSQDSGLKRVEEKQ